MKRHRSPGAATYPGDVRHIVGEVKGPTTFGTFLVAEHAAYELLQGGADRTRVTFAVCTDEDVDRIVETGVARLDMATTC